MRVHRRKDVINAVYYDGDQEVIIEEIQKVITEDQTVEPSREGSQDISVHGWNHNQDYINVTVRLGEYFVIRGDGKFRSLTANEYKYKYVEAERPEPHRPTGPKIVLRVMKNGNIWDYTKHIADVNAWSRKILAEEPDARIEVEYASEEEWYNWRTGGL